MSDISLNELADRVRALEDIVAIRNVQYDYWRSIDLKRPDALREVFAPGEILIDFEDMPAWRDREDFVQFFIKLGMDTTRQENHFGVSPKIEMTGSDTAKGYWRLHMFAYDFARRITIRVTGEYDCEYVRVDNAWKIKTFIFKRKSLYTESVAQNGDLSAVGFGGVPEDSSAYLFGTAEAEGERA